MRHRPFPPWCASWALSNLEQITELESRVRELGNRLRAAAGDDETTRRLLTMPGIGPITVVAVETFAPPMESFRRRRDFAA